MSITQLASFMTSDGKVFQSMEEARTHEISIEMESSINELAERLEIPSRTVSVIKRWLPIFIAELDYVKAPDPVNFSDTAEVGADTADITSLSSAAA